MPLGDLAMVHVHLGDTLRAAAAGTAYPKMARDVDMKSPHTIHAVHVVKEGKLIEYAGKVQGTARQTDQQIFVIAISQRVWYMFVLPKAGD